MRPHRRHRRRRASSARTCATRCSRAATRSSRSTTSRPAARENIAHLRRPPRLRRSCVADVVARSSRSTGRVDGVLHFASPASPPEYLAMPLETLDVELARHPARARPRARATTRGSCSRRRARSTAIPLVHPQTEDYHGNVDPIGPARGVRRGEAVRRDADDDVPPPVRPADTAIVRIFNTYGPRLRPADGRVVSNFLVQAIDGQAAHDLRRRRRRPGRSATSTTRCAGSSRCSTPTSSIR